MSEEDWGANDPVAEKDWGANDPVASAPAPAPKTFQGVLPALGQGIVNAPGAALSAGWSGLKQAGSELNPFSQERQQGSVLENTLRTGRGILHGLEAIPGGVTAGVSEAFGPAYGELVHKAGTVIAPQTAAKDNPEVLHQMGREAVGEASSAVGARAGPVSTLGSIPKPAPFSASEMLDTIRNVKNPGLPGNMVESLPKRPVAPTAPTSADYKEAVDNGFNNLRGYGVELKKSNITKMVDDTIQELEAKGRTQANSPNTYAALERLKNPKGENVTFNDIDSVRQEFGHVAPDERFAGMVARKNLLDYLGDLSPSDAAVNGHFVTRLKPELQEAVSNSHIQHQLENFDEIRNWAENSKRDTNEAILAKWRTVLANKNARRGIPDDIRQAMTSAVREGTLDKALGALARLSPERFSGWFPTLMLTAAGRLEALGLPAIGLAAKTIKNVGAGRDISAVEKMLAQRGPLYQQQLAKYKEAAGAGMTASRKPVKPPLSPNGPPDEEGQRPRVYMPFP